MMKFHVDLGIRSGTELEEQYLRQYALCLWVYLSTVFSLAVLHCVPLLEVQKINIGSTAAISLLLFFI